MKVHTCTRFHPPSPFMLVGAFNPLIFKVIIDIFIGRTDVEAETPILWLPDAKS